MPDIRETDIQKQLRAGRPSPVYLIYGDDRYRKNICAETLIKGLMPPTMPDINYSRFYGGRDEMKTVRETCFQLPMMDDLRLTVMEDYPLDKLTASDAALLMETIEGLSGQCVIVIWQNDVEIDTRKKAFTDILQTVRSRGSVLKLDIPTVNETARTLCGLAESKGAKLSLADANYMVRRCGRDMVLLSSELEKLALYAGKKNITRQIIDEICPASLEADVYHISKYILWGRTEDALRVTDSLLIQRAKPVEIFTVLSQSFVDLYRAKCAALSGMDADGLRKLYSADYPRSRAFRADNAMRDQREYSMMQLRAYIELLTDAELKLKSGRRDRRTCIEQLIIRLCLVKRGGVN